MTTAQVEEVAESEGLQESRYLLWVHFHDTLGAWPPWREDSGEGRVTLSNAVAGLAPVRTSSHVLFLQRVSGTRLLVTTLCFGVIQHK